MHEIRFEYIYIRMFPLTRKLNVLLIEIEILQWPDCVALKKMVYIVLLTSRVYLYPEFNSVHVSLQSFLR